MEPSYPLVADVRMTRKRTRYVRRRPGSLYQVTAGKSRPAIVNVFEPMLRECDQTDVKRIGR